MGGSVHGSKEHGVCHLSLLIADSSFQGGVFLESCVQWLAMLGRHVPQSVQLVTINECSTLEEQPSFSMCGCFSQHKSCLFWCLMGVFSEKSDHLTDSWPWSLLHPCHGCHIPCKRSHLFESECLFVKRSESFVSGDLLLLAVELCCVESCKSEVVSHTIQKPLPFLFEWCAS